MDIIQFDPATPITQPGVYRMSDEQYRADPCATPSLNSSVAKLALPGDKGGSAMHMQWEHPKTRPTPKEPEPKKAFELGSAFHALMLGAGSEIVVVDAPTWQSKAAKEARDQAHKDGKNPVLAEQWKRAQAMHRRVWDQLPGFANIHEAMQKGHPELVLVWQEDTPGGPILCRSQLDWIPEVGKDFPDWKTTGTCAAPATYGKTMFNMDADVQAVFYERGIKAVLGMDARIVFPVVETYEPHALAVHAITPAARAQTERKVAYAIQTWGICLARGIWPGYPNQTAEQDPPPWRETMWTEWEDMGLAKADYTSRMIDLMAQAPLKMDTGMDDEMREDFGL